jgi:hypothetical protein
MWRDVHFGIRQIGRKKLFSLVLILLLAIGIGANTVVFSFVNTLLLTSLPVRAPHNLYLIQRMRARQVRPDPAGMRPARRRWASTSESIRSFLIRADAIARTFRGWASKTSSLISSSQSYIGPQL